ncbi:GHMP family kinase ATP-binding protein [Alteromonas sp. CYL-A6]|uniref:GHMP family kinase ATP-binding protein n=1 Tax=Alteromonas nitratireducens TaxID=3390813 RepID=UPI0034BD091B
MYYKKSPGLVLSTAVDQFIYITVNKKFDDLIRVSYSKTEITDSVDKIEHNIIREALKLVGIEKGIEIVYMGDVPLGSAGTGLGSSSALAVGVLNALYAYTGQHIDAETLAQQASQIEIDILGNPMGKQDQYASAYGGLNSIQFNADESVFVDPVIFSQETKNILESKFLMFYTGIERLSSSILGDQQSNIKDNYAQISQVVELARQGIDALRQNDIASIGPLLHESWLLKKQFAQGVSNQVLDDIYDAAMKAGAAGGKLLGAGGGGFFLFYCEPEYQEAVRQALGHLKETKFRFEPQGSKIIYVNNP